MAPLLFVLGATLAMLATQMPPAADLQGPGGAARLALVEARTPGP